MMKDLGAGNEPFPDLIESSSYCVDKTAFMKPLLASSSKVHLPTLSTKTHVIPLKALPTLGLTRIRPLHFDVAHM